MVHRWIWIAFALISLDAIAGQQNPNAQITVQVTDVTGAFVPKALIEVSATQSGPPMTREADESGKGKFELPIGSYHLLVKSPGFCSYKGPVEVLKQQNQIFTAKLQVDTCPGPCEVACIAVLPEPETQVTLTVLVTDQSGAVIPGAHVVASNQATGMRFQAVASATGEAVVPLDPGVYALRVEARAFQIYEEKEVQAKMPMQKAVTLAISPLIECGPCVEGIDPPFALEHQQLQEEIPSIPVGQLVLPARHLHPRRHWL